MKEDLLPVFVTFHAEPDGLYLNRSDAVPWEGFEKTFDFIKGMRDEGIIQELNFVWLLRADPQIEIIYEDVAWGFKKYASQFNKLASMGDELGLHIHPYRLKGKGYEWVQDFTDTKWMSHCILTGFKAFDLFFNRKPNSLSIGPNSTYNDVVQTCRSLGLKYDFTLSRNGKKDFNQEHGDIKGKMNWIKDLPGYPYTPSKSDITKESKDREDYFLIPVQYFTFQHGFLNWKGLVKKLLFGQSDYRRLKPSLSMNPDRFKNCFTMMKKEGMEYLLIDTRTHVFTQKKAEENIRANLLYLQEMNGSSVSVVTPSSGVCEKWAKKRKSQL